MKHLFGCDVLLYTSNSSQLKMLSDKRMALAKKVFYLSNTTTFVDLHYLFRSFHKKKVLSPSVLYKSVGFGSYSNLSVALAKNYMHLSFLRVSHPAAIPLSLLPLGFFSFFEFFFLSDFFKNLNFNLRSHYFYYFFINFNLKLSLGLLSLKDLSSNFNLAGSSIFIRYLLFKFVFLLRSFFGVSSSYSLLSLSNNLVSPIKHFSTSLYNYCNILSDFTSNFNTFERAPSNFLLGLSIYSSLNSNLVKWRTRSSGIFKSNFLSLIFKTSRNNIFITLVNSDGAVIWKTSGGSMGLHGKDKSSIESIRRLSQRVVVFLRQKNIINSFIFRFFFVQTLEHVKAQQFMSALARNAIYFSFVTFDSRIPHGYMRLRKPRRL